MAAFSILLSDAGVQAGGKERIWWLRKWTLADRDSHDNLIDLLCITGHRFLRTNVKTGLPPSQQGFGVKKGSDLQWKKLCCGGARYPSQEQQTLGTMVCTRQGSALHGVALT